MEENKLLEKLWSEAQSVEVPPELEPEQIRARIEAEGGRTSMKDKSEQKRKRFHWHGYGSRVAAAAIVLVASMGAFGVANSQNMVPITEGVQMRQRTREDRRTGNSRPRVLLEMSHRPQKGLIRSKRWEITGWQTAMKRSARC